MSLTVEELKTLRYCIFVEWEMRYGVAWCVNGVNMPQLHKKLTVIIEGMNDDAKEAKELY